MKLSFSNLLKLYFLLSIVFILAAAYFTFTNINRLVANEDEISHTHEVLYNLENVFSTVKDAETSQRGFLLTGKKEFLTPYYGAYDLTRNYYDKLRLLTQDNVMQQMRLDSLDGFINARFRLLSERLDDANKPKLAPNEIELLSKGRDVMVKLRALVDRMENAEEELLQHRTVNAKESSTITYVVAGIFSIISVVIIIIAYSFTMNEFQKRTRLEGQLSENIEKLRVTNENLEQFAYVASHDLQEPLRKIRAFGDLLKSDFTDSLPERGVDYINRMHSAAIRMQVLISDLLNFSRASRNVGNRIDIDLKKIIDEVLSDLDITISDADAKIQMDVPGKMVVEGNATQLGQLFMNLISNAVKFRKKDTKPVVIISGERISGEKKIKDIQLQKDKEYYTISVKDNGIGFDEKYLDKIFVIFQRLHSKTEYKGTGIGLALCKKIMENHGGFILAESKLGEGSVFTVIFPIK